MPPSAVSAENAIVCVRHGETIWKRQGRTQGQLDSPLTDTGISQVHELAGKLEFENFGIILSSPLGRAVQTAEILSRHLGLPNLRQSDHLAERCEGAFQGLTRKQQAERFPECIDKESGHVNPDLIPGPESTTDFLDRVTVGLQEIGSFAETRNVLVVTHTGVLQALTSLISGEDFLEVCAKRSFGFCDVLRFGSVQNWNTVGRTNA